MLAAIVDRYGPPEALVIREVPTPTPGPEQVLVRIHASVVTPSDVAFRNGELWSASPRNQHDRRRHQTGHQPQSKVAGADGRTCGDAERADHNQDRAPGAGQPGARQILQHRRVLFQFC